MVETLRHKRLWLLRHQLQIAREDGHEHEILRIESLIAGIEREIAAECLARGQESQISGLPRRPARSEH